MPLRDELDAARNLLGRLTRSRNCASPPIARDAAAFGEAVLGVDLVEVLRDHELDAEVASCPSSPDSARKMTSRSSGTFSRFSSSIVISAGGEVVLVVDRAAAVDVAAVARRAERRELPLRRVDGDVVGVPHDEQRPLLAVALQPRDDVRAVGIEGEELRTECLRRRRPASDTRPRDARCRADWWCRAAAPPGSAA